MVLVAAAAEAEHGRFGGHGPTLTAKHAIAGGAVVGIVAGGAGLRLVGEASYMDGVDVGEIGPCNSIVTTEADAGGRNGQLRPGVPGRQKSLFWLWPWGVAPGAVAVRRRSLGWHAPNDRDDDEGQ